MAGLMSPQNKKLALFAVTAYVVSVPLSTALFGMSARAWLLLAALVPCAIATGWVNYLRGGAVALLSYLSFGWLAQLACRLLRTRRLPGCGRLCWYFLVVGTVMFGLPLVVVGAVTGFVADKLFSNTSR
jgi:hypothetical protein